MAGFKKRGPGRVKPAGFTPTLKEHIDELEAKGIAKRVRARKSRPEMQAYIKGPLAEQIELASRKSARHPQPCGCAHCPPISCILCPSFERGATFNGAVGFGSHVYKVHPGVHMDWYTEVTVMGRPRVKSGVNALVRKAPQQAIELAREIRAAEELEKASVIGGIRAIPLDDLTETTRKQVGHFLKAMENVPGVRKRLFMEAVAKVDDGFKTEQSYLRAIQNAQTVIEEATRAKKYAVMKRETYFDPRIMLECVKLSHALDQGFSFVVHLLCLYGLKAMVAGLKREGITPPTDVTHLPMPADVMLANELITVLEKRRLRMDEDPELLAFGMPDEDTPDSVAARLIDGYESTFKDDEIEETDHDGRVWGQIRSGA